MVLSALRYWFRRRRMWQRRTCWTWPRKQSNDPIVRAVKNWKRLPSMEQK
jgi:hypothetical protein